VTPTGEPVTEHIIIERRHRMMRRWADHLDSLREDARTKSKATVKLLKVDDAIYPIEVSSQFYHINTRILKRISIKKNSLPLAFMGLPQIPEIIPISRRAWWQRSKNEHFPKPVKLGPKATSWRAEDIAALTERMEAQNFS